ncbi:MAG: pseudaminic acid cytidylyltransferase [Ktedonobacteraceae bacterium]
MRVAIIPARGGSKRIPRKNIRDFAGKPMIAHSIINAMESALFERIIVSTDDEEIARIAREIGAEVPFMRPAKLADDYVGTTEVVAHAIDWLFASGTSPSAACCIYATAPLIRSEDLRRGLDILESGRWQYVFAATTFASPIFRSFEVGPGGGVQMLFPERFESRSQDLPEVWHDAGQFYWGTSDAWIQKVRVFGPSSMIVPIPRWRVVDIDTEEDWQCAELISGALVEESYRGRAGSN